MRFEVYQAQDGYRWRAWARNGRIVAEGGEAYTRGYDAFRAVARLFAVRAPRSVGASRSVAMPDGSRHPI